MGAGRQRGSRKPRQGGFVLWLLWGSAIPRCSSPSLLLLSDGPGRAGSSWGLDYLGQFHALKEQEGSSTMVRGWRKDPSFLAFPDVSGDLLRASLPSECCCRRGVGTSCSSCPCAPGAAGSRVSSPGLPREVLFHELTLGTRSGGGSALCGVWHCPLCATLPWRVIRGKHKAGQAPGEVWIGY